MGVDGATAETSTTTKLPRQRKARNSKAQEMPDLPLYSYEDSEFFTAGSTDAPGKAKKVYTQCPEETDMLISSLQR